MQSCLRQGDVDSAIEALYAEVDHGDSSPAQHATHDVGLLRFLVADSAVDVDAATDEYRASIGTLIASARARSSDPELVALITRRLLITVAERARDLVASDGIEAACGLLNILSDIPCEYTHIEAACRIPFKQLFANIHSTCDRIKQLVDDPSAEEESKESGDLVDSLRTSAIVPISTIVRHCDLYIGDMESTCDAVVNCGAALAISINNDGEDYQSAYDLLSWLAELPASQSRLEKLFANRDTVGGNLVNALMSEGVVLEEAEKWDEAEAKYTAAIALAGSPPNLSYCTPDQYQTMQQILRRCSRGKEIGSHGVPVSGTPSLSTINGLGCRFYGREDGGSTDGYYVTTHWVVALYIPILALARYLVKDAGDGAYLIARRLPLARWQKTWNLGLLGVLAIGFLAMLIVSGDESTSSSSPSTYSEKATTGSSQPRTGVGDSRTMPEVTDVTGQIEAHRLRDSIDAADALLGDWQLELDSLRRSLDKLERQIETAKAEKESMERAADGGESIDNASYELLIQEANRRVREYSSTRDKHNALVGKFNALLKERNSDLEELKRLEGDTP